MTTMLGQSSHADQLHEAHKSFFKDIWVRVKTTLQPQEYL
jgi:hypothetical protein